MDCLISQTFGPHWNKSTRFSLDLTRIKHVDQIISVPESSVSVLTNYAFRCTKFASFPSGRENFPTSGKRQISHQYIRKATGKIRRTTEPFHFFAYVARFQKKTIYNALSDHILPALTNTQHGFIPKRSCASNLAVFLRHAWDSIAAGCQTDAIYTDYSSAFQSVNHKLLLYKLENAYHVSDKMLSLIRSYLTGRRQRVIVNGAVSDWADVTSGVPEGSLLAPLLFALFVNDLPSSIDSECLMFADDVKIFRRVASVDDATRLQRDIDSLYKWSADWMLSLNPLKCKSFTMTLRRTPVRFEYKVHNATLQRETVMRDLGVYLDSKLTFAQHMAKTVICEPSSRTFY